MADRRRTPGGVVAAAQVTEDVYRLLRSNPGGVSDADVEDFLAFVRRATVDWTLVELFRAGTVRLTYRDGEMHCEWVGAPPDREED